MIQNKAKYIDPLKLLAKKYSVKLKVAKSDSNRWVGRALGRYDPDKSTIILYPDAFKSKSILISTFFHELGHDFCCKNGLWKVMHGQSKFTLNKYKKIFVKAEKWVDHWGKMEMQKIYPKLKYQLLPSDKDYKIYLIARLHELVNGDKPHKSIFSLKTAAITPNIVGHNMLAKCGGCNYVFSYKNKSKQIQWVCPKCSLAAFIKCR